MLSLYEPFLGKIKVFFPPELFDDLNGLNVLTKLTGKMNTGGMVVENF